MPDGQATDSTVVEWSRDLARELLPGVLLDTGERVGSLADDYVNSFSGQERGGQQFEVGRTAAAMGTELCQPAAGPMVALFAEERVVRA